MADLDINPPNSSNSGPPPSGGGSLDADSSRLRSSWHREVLDSFKELNPGVNLDNASLDKSLSYRSLDRWGKIHRRQLEQLTMARKLYRIVNGQFAPTSRALKDFLSGSFGAINELWQQEMGVTGVTGIPRIFNDNYTISEAEEWLADRGLFGMGYKRKKQQDQQTGLSPRIPVPQSASKSQQPAKDQSPINKVSEPQSRPQQVQAQPEDAFDDEEASGVPLPGGLAGADVNRFASAVRPGPRLQMPVTQGGSKRAQRRARGKARGQQSRSGSKTERVSQTAQGEEIEAKTRVEGGAAQNSAEGGEESSGVFSTENVISKIPRTQIKAEVGVNEPEQGDYLTPGFAEAEMGGDAGDGVTPGVIGVDGSITPGIVQSKKKQRGGKRRHAKLAEQGAPGLGVKAKAGRPGAAQAQGQEESGVQRVGAVVAAQAPQTQAAVGASEDQAVIPAAAKKGGASKPSGGEASGQDQGQPGARENETKSKFSGQRNFDQEENDEALIGASAGQEQAEAAVAPEPQEEQAVLEEDAQQPDAVSQEAVTPAGEEDDDEDSIINRNEAPQEGAVVDDYLPPGEVDSASPQNLKSPFKNFATQEYRRLLRKARGRAKDRNLPGGKKGQQTPEEAQRTPQEQWPDFDISDDQAAARFNGLSPEDQLGFVNRWLNKSGAKKRKAIPRISGWKLKLLEAASRKYPELDEILRKVKVEAYRAAHGLDDERPRPRDDKRTTLEADFTYWVKRIGAEYVIKWYVFPYASVSAFWDAGIEAVIAFIILNIYWVISLFTPSAYFQGLVRWQKWLIVGVDITLLIILFIILLVVVVGFCQQTGASLVVSYCTTVNEAVGDIMSSAIGSKLTLPSQ